MRNKNLDRLHGPDDGFHTGYDQDGSYAGTTENVEGVESLAALW